jgi:hypothetical protein
MLESPCQIEIYLNVSVNPKGSFTLFCHECMLNRDRTMSDYSYFGFLGQYDTKRNCVLLPKVAKPSKVAGFAAAVAFFTPKFCPCKYSLWNKYLQQFFMLKFIK